jgi:hypothetical protein
MLQSKRGLHCEQPIYGQSMISLLMVIFLDGALKVGLLAQYACVIVKPSDFAMVTKLAGLIAIVVSYLVTMFLDLKQMHLERTQ